MFDYAEKRGWARANPVALADKPRIEPRDSDIRYLEIGELEALIGAVPDDELGAVERVLYRTAAMTGLRRGELLALRWRDVDWPSGLIRVRRNFTRGEFGTPKSPRSSRAVPLADVVAGELERHTFSDRSSRVMTISSSRIPSWGPSSIPQSCVSASRKQRNLPD
jgi:integrase